MYIQSFGFIRRNQAMGISSVGGRLGNMLAPFSSYVVGTFVVVQPRGQPGPHVMFNWIVTKSWRTTLVAIESYIQKPWGAPQRYFMRKISTVWKGCLETLVSLRQARQVPWLPGVLFGALSIAVGILALVLPETLNRPLPQTIEDIENWSRKKPKSSPQADNEHNTAKHELLEIGNDVNA